MTLTSMMLMLMRREMRGIRVEVQHVAQLQHSEHRFVQMQRGEIASPLSVECHHEVSEEGILHWRPSSQRPSTLRLKLIQTANSINWQCGYLGGWRDARCVALHPLLLLLLLLELSGPRTRHVQQVDGSAAESSHVTVIPESTQLVLQENG